jgi:hypothetical protein
VTGVWAVVPVKELADAKQRLSSCLSPEERRALATIMLEDVLDALSAVKQLAGIIVVTVDPRSLAGRYGRAQQTERMRRIGVLSQHARDSGLLSYGRYQSFEGMRGAATYVDRILRGTKPGDLPVQFPTKFEMAVNLKTRRSGLRCRSQFCCAPTR